MHIGPVHRHHPGKKGGHGHHHGEHGHHHGGGAPEDGHDHEHVHENGTCHSHPHEHEAGKEHVHAHDHGEEHEHSHPHVHGHEHSHDLGLSHGHEHGHEHGEGVELRTGEISSEQKLTKMVSYFAAHSEEHAQTYAQWAEKAREMGRADVAELLARAAEDTAKATGIFREVEKLLS